MSEKFKAAEPERQTPLLKIAVFVGIGFVSGLLSGYRSATDNECWPERVPVTQPDSKE